MVCENVSVPTVTRIGPRHDLKQLPDSGMESEQKSNSHCSRHFKLHLFIKSFFWDKLDLSPLGSFLWCTGVSTHAQAEEGGKGGQDEETEGGEGGVAYGCLEVARKH
eukprot:315430-Amphidinium_carterae.1